MKCSGREDEIFNMYDKTIMFLMTQINQNISHETNVELNVDDKQQQKTFRLDIFNLRNNDVREFKKKVMFLNTILFDHVKT